MVVDLLCLAILAGLMDEPAEQRQPVFAHALWMPLHADDRLHLTALDGLDNAVGSSCSNAEVRAGVADGLMMERVYGQCTRIAVIVSRDGRAEVLKYIK